MARITIHGLSDDVERGLQDLVDVLAQAAKNAAKAVEERDQAIARAEAAEAEVTELRKALDGAS